MLRKKSTYEKFPKISNVEKNFFEFFPNLHSLYSKSAHFYIKEAKFVKKWYLSTHDTKCSFQFFGGTTTSLNGIMSGILVSALPLLTVRLNYFNQNIIFL